MVTKALETYSYYDIAHENSYKLLEQMSETYKSLTRLTVWECYSPSAPRPSERQYGCRRELVRADFFGWSALRPISLFIKYVLGFYNIEVNKKLME